MHLNRTEYAAVLVLLTTFAVTGYGFTALSGEIAVHFDATGEPDDYMHVVPGLLLLPFLATALLVLFHYLPRIDPLGENYASFADLFDLLKLLLVAILGYVQTAIILWNMGYTFDPTYLVMPVITSAYYLTGKIMERADRNWFIGIRTPWTLSSDHVWRRTHDTTAPLLKSAAVIALAGPLIPEYSVYLYALPAAAIAVFATVYSYWLYREEDT